MEFMEFILKFFGITAVVSGVMIFVLYRVFISSTDGAVKRLDDEISKATAKQAELGKKLKDADDELNKKQQEAKELAEKMRSDAEEASKTEREKIINKAREEGEEIIAKAQSSIEKMRVDLEKEIDIKAITRSLEILNQVLSEKAKGALDGILVEQYISGLEYN